MEKNGNVNNNKNDSIGEHTNAPLQEESLLLVDPPHHGSNNATVTKRDDAKNKHNKSERKRLKKERKRKKKERKKEKKRAMKQKAKQQQQQLKKNAFVASSAASASSCASSSSSSSSPMLLLSPRQKDENDKQSSVSGTEDNNKDNNAAQFSDPEEEKYDPARIVAGAANIPRKCKRKRSLIQEDDDTNGNQNQNQNCASLISNLQPIKKTSAANIFFEKDDGDNNNNSNSNNNYEDVEYFRNDPPDISLNALKQNILGRQVQSFNDHHDDEDVSDDDDFKMTAVNNATTSTKTVISPELRRELSCSICHEVLFQPVSLLCGHSFCRECLSWWWKSNNTTNSNIKNNHATNNNCPTCRRTYCDTNGNDNDNYFQFLGINTALRASVMALFSEEVQGRKEALRKAQRQATRGENGGAHNGGYCVISTTNDDVWKLPWNQRGSAAIWPCRRSIVLDAEDQRMQLALGFYKDATTMGMTYSVRTQSLHVSLCLLTMEEDEVADGGFPRVIVDDDDDDENDNEHLLVSRSGGRFVHSFVRATAKLTETTYDSSSSYSSSSSRPLGRWAIQSSGAVEMLMDLSQLPSHIAMIVFEHEETGATLELQAVDSNKMAGRFDAVGRGGVNAATDTNTNGREDDYEERAQRLQYYQTYDKDEDNGSHLDEFENDGFIAQEADDDEEEHESENYDDDLCDVCRKPGDLMVCDGGDNIEGCGRSVHIDCVRRAVVPSGDWICQSCANDLQLGVGIEGYEFPPEAESIRDSEEDNDDDKAEVDQPVKRKRLIKSGPAMDLDDSDSEEENEKNDQASNSSAIPGRRRIGGDSDEDADGCKKPATAVPTKKKSRISAIDSDSE